MNFYDKVTEENAKDWYEKLPAHLRKQIDTERAKFKPGTVCPRKELPALYATVEKELGARPLRPADPADPLDGHTQKQIAQFEAHKRWGARYDELLLIGLVVSRAEAIQRERKMMNEIMGLDVDGNVLPNQSEGLDQTTAATVRWIQNTGETPLEFLAKTYRDTEAKMSDRLAAARTMMEYVHRRVPVKTETETKDITEPKLDPKVLKGLSEKELEVLEKLLAKLGSSGG